MIHWRHRGLHGTRRLNRQRRQSLILLAFGAVRIVAWMILGVCVALGLAHAGGFGWAKTLSRSVPFVALISIYANWATDLDAATAAFAALVASDSHHDVEHVRRAIGVDFAALEADVAKLAALQPGPAANELATQIRARLAA